MIGVQGMITVKTNKAGETEHEIGAFLPSRTGATFQAIVTTDLPDSREITILTNHGNGYRSAHRDYARSCGYRALRNGPISWRNASGVRVVLTRWGR
jgi:hypothetical protein